MKLPLMETFENAKKCQNSKPSPEKWMKNFSRQKMCGQQNEKKNKKQVFRSKTWMWLIFEKEEEHFKNKILKKYKNVNFR